MKMQQGIRVHNLLPIGNEAVTINSGTVLHTENEAAMVSYAGVEYVPKYESNAYVPKKDWRPLDAHEIELLLSTEDRKVYDTVYLGELPTELKRTFEDLNLVTAKDRHEIIPMIEQQPELAGVLNEQLGQFLLSMSTDNQFELFCVGANLPNMETIGFNPKNYKGGYEDQHKHFMGLHIDRSKVAEIDQVHTLGNRICLNLGSESRYLLFVNLSIIQVYEMLKEKMDVVEKKVDCTNVAQFFFTHYPDYPVVRVKQDPYQYYIAPTDNCFHDGSSLGKKELDITMVFFGAFKV
ncbi:MAG: hypothetical protein AAGA77_13275 [Bacteroidota bacterium]